MTRCAAPWATMAVCALCACPSTPHHAPAEAAGACVNSQNCGGRFVCVLPDASGVGTCVSYICASPQDCPQGQVCAVPRGVCVDRACDPQDPNACSAGQCTNVSAPWTQELPKLVSSCQAPTTPTQGCVFDTQQWVTGVDGWHDVAVFGAGDSGAVVPYGDFSLTVDPPNVVSVEGLRLTAHAPGGALVRATSANGQAQCTFPVYVLAPPEAGTARVLVVDAKTQAPVQGAVVQLRLPGGERISAADAQGMVTFLDVNVPPQDILDVSAFANTSSDWPGGYDHLTYVRPNTVDLMMGLTRVAKPDVLAVRSVTSHVPRFPPGALSLALSGLSWHRGWEELSLATLEGMARPGVVDLPALGVNQLPIWAPTQIEMVFHPSTLVGAAKPQANMDCQGALCRFVAWGLGTQAALGPLPSLVDGMARMDRRGGDTLWTVMPSLRNGYHGLSWDPQVDAWTLAQLMHPTLAALPVLDLEDAVFAQLATAWVIPVLPFEGDTALPQVILLAGTQVPSFGFVPLGIEGATDACVPANGFECVHSPQVDGVVSCANSQGAGARCTDVSTGVMLLNHAPPHDGLERFTQVTLALASKPVEEDLPGRTLSVLVSRERALPTIPNAFPQRAWLDIPHARLNANQDLLELTSPVPNANYYRVQLRGVAPPAAMGRRWTLVLPQSATTTTVQVPPVPAGVEALALDSWVVTVAVRLEHGVGHPAHFTRMLEPGSYPLVEEVLHVTALSQGH